MRIRLNITTLIVVLLGIMPAAAEDVGFGAFKAPVLDGVRAEAGTPTSSDDPVPYLFQGGHAWPAVRLAARSPLDWRRAGSLAVPVENLGPAPFELLLRLDDRPEADGGDRSLTGVVTVPPHVRATVVLPFDKAPPGMRSRPPSTVVARPGDLLMSNVLGSVDLAHVVALHISGVQTEDDRRLAIGDFALRARPPGPVAFGPIVDTFGQPLAGTWPEKVADTADLRRRLSDAAAETQRLARTAAHPADVFGGVDAATRLDATGYFRTQKVGGRWSLVTPAGHRFFSLGVDAVMAQNPTIVAGREAAFEGLPAEGTPLAAYYGQTRAGARTFDVGSANLQRGLGPDWRRLWDRQVVGRLGAWGFNTLGSWSETAVTGQGMPHVALYDFEGASASIPMPYGRDLPDPFDPRFAAVADAAAQAVTAGQQTDRTLIGYFSGNEMPWGSTDRPEMGITAHVLALGRDSDAKRALLDGLRSRYGTTAALAAAWRLPISTDWSDLAAHPLAWPANPTAAATQDAAAFDGHFADLYFRTVAQAIRRHDPNHLYLGTRFASFTPEVVRACARWCDVLSFNVYARSPEAEAEAAAWRGLDRPVLIGEFHFGSNDRGAFWPGMVDVGREADRGPAYAAYVAAAVDDPQIVGCHWYQYADEPPTGRPFDGENGHIGLVAVTDVPYANFVADVTAANRAAIGRFARTAADPRRGTPSSSGPSGLNVGSPNR